MSHAEFTDKSGRVQRSLLSSLVITCFSAQALAAPDSECPKAASLPAKTSTDVSPGKKQEPPLRHALLLNPLPSLLGLGLTLVSPDVDSMVSFSARYHQALLSRVGITFAPSVTVANVLGIEFMTAAIKTGPRFTLSPTGLSGFYVTPLLIAGALRGADHDHSLARAGLWGAGVEAGYLARWDGWLLESGLGAQYTDYFSHTSFDGSPIRGGAFAPIFNLSVGYGW